MRAVGPDAPTLCGDWTTRDLAAHLVLRERRPDAAAGILISKLAGYTARKQKELTERTEWPDLLELVASGPPLYSPLKLLDPLVNTTEMFIHHEDVRRAAPGWQPRAARRRPGDRAAPTGARRHPDVTGSGPRGGDAAGPRRREAGIDR